MTAGHDGGAQDAPDTEYGPPVIRDKRKIDPETGKARTSSGAAPDDAAPAGGTGSATGTGPDAAAPLDGAGSATGAVPDDAAPVAGTVPGAEDARAAAAGAAPEGEEAGGEDPLLTARAEAGELADQLARRNADLYNLQQEYNGYVRRAKAAAGEQRTAGQAEVVEALLAVLDEIELARQHGDLTGPVGATAEKLETTLVQRFGVERFGAQGEGFDPERHEALMSTPDPEATTPTVAQVMQPGYRMGEKVLRAARVGVASPE